MVDLENNTSTNHELTESIEYNKLKIIVTSRIWIPAVLIKEGVLKIKPAYLEELKKTIYDESACNKCPNRYRRPCSFCKNCKALVKIINLCSYKHITFKENPGIDEYFCLPLDCLRTLEANID